MLLPSSPEPPQAARDSLGRPAAPSEEPSWILKRLDSLLSEDLRRASPTDLARHRFLVGAACFFLGMSLLYVLSGLFLPKRILPASVTCLSYLGTLIMARRARKLVGPALLLVSTFSISYVSVVFSSRSALTSVHASTMLLPALAVYLLGSRMGLLLTGLVALALMVAHPLYMSLLGIPDVPPSPSQIWSTHVFGALAFLGAWWLAAVNGTARDAAQNSLERTLKTLRESESKLRSVIESTHDVVVSLDAEGRVLTANSSAQRLYQTRLGTALDPGSKLLPERGAAQSTQWGERLARALRGERLYFEEEYLFEDRRIVLDVSINPILGEEDQPVGLTIFGRDITARKEAEARLGEMHRTLVDVSRQAGMAEIATGVLHNVGNTLNSVNVSASIVTDQLRTSRINSLTKATNLLREHTADFSTFLTQDPQGQKLPSYLVALSDWLQEEREALLQEMGALSESVDHIKSIVSMQQKHARSAGAVEEVGVPQLIDEALRLHAVPFEREGIRIDRDYAEVPLIQVDRHKLLQILINLLSNARHALADSQTQDRCLRIRVRLAPEGGRMLIEVEDNGTGIAPEHLRRIFMQGFTTKKEGHGFGLHISALAAMEMKGRLSCVSSGPGQGATFTLELPLAVEPAAGRA